MPDWCGRNARRRSRSAALQGGASSPRPSSTGLMLLPSQLANRFHLDMEVGCLPPDVHGRACLPQPLATDVPPSWSHARSPADVVLHGNERLHARNSGCASPRPSQCSLLRQRLHARNAHPRDCALRARACKALDTALRSTIAGSARLVSTLSPTLGIVMRPGRAVLLDQGCFRSWLPILPAELSD